MGNAESAPGARSVLDDALADARLAVAELSESLNGTKAAREKGWRATGIIALRDGNLRELPASALDPSLGAKALDATNNRLTALPPAIGALKSLQRLVLSQNSLTALPPAVCSLSALKILTLDANALTELPAALGQLAALERLSVAGNALATLPPSLGALRKLRVLVVSGNRLSALPAEIGECAELEELDARNNALASLPPEAGRLARLRAALLDGNALRGVPPEVLRGCAMLQTLSLHGCPVRQEELAETAGWAEFEARLRDKHGKRVAGGVMLGAAGLDDGLDHQTTRIVVPHT